MGITAEFVARLTEYRRSGRVARAERVTELGAQQLSIAFLGASELLGPLFAAFGRPAWLPPPPPAIEIAHGSAVSMPADAPLARPFWEALGYAYTSIDVDGSPGAIPLDLNVDLVPEEWRSGSDVVTNFGTTEHVCNQRNAFRIMHDLARPGALLMHYLPLRGYLAHGLVNYSPRFFLRLAEANGYEILMLETERDAVTYPAQDHIASAIRSVGGDAGAIAGYELQDSVIRLILQKHGDRPFVSPARRSAQPAGAGRARPYRPVLWPESFQATSDQRFQVGKDAYGRGDFVAARLAWEPMAERGYAAAQTGMGILRLLGQGIATDREVGVRWLEAAAAQGSDEAKRLLSG